MYSANIEYRVSFSAAIDPSSFSTSDILNTGTGGGMTLNWSIENCGDDTNFKLTAITIEGDGTIVPNVVISSVTDASGNKTQASTATDNEVTFIRGWYQEAYIKAVNSDAGDNFGGTVSINGDTLAVGVPSEASNQTTITNGTAASSDNSNNGSGAVYVYKRSGGSWYQEAYIKAVNNDANDSFGSAVSISGDTLAVGSIGEDSNQTTITNGASASTNNSNTDSGAVYIYKRLGSTWTQEAYIKAINNNANDWFGYPVSLHGDTLAVGAIAESSNQNTITNGATASANNSNFFSGAVYIYKRTGSVWVQEAYIKAVNNDVTGDAFAQNISLSDDTLAVSATGEDSNQTTITNGTTASVDNSNTSSGAVYVYKRNGVTWAQEAYIKAANSESLDYFGHSISLRGDTLAVGAYYEDSNQTSITNGATASSNNSNSASGAVYVYKRLGVTWAQEAYIKAVNNSSFDYFGVSVSLHGNSLAVGAIGESSNQTTITNVATATANNSKYFSGAVYIYKRAGSAWTQEAYLKATNADSMDNYGGVSLSGDTLAVGVPSEDSSQTTITNGETASADNSSVDSGAVYVYRNRSRLFEVVDLAASATSNSVTLNWIKPGGSATGFVVSYQLGATAPASCSSGTVVSVGDVDTHTEFSLTNSTSYSFRVCATDGVTETDGVTMTVTTLP